MTGEGSRARDLSLPELGALCVEGGTLPDHLIRRLELRGEELELRWRSSRLRVFARIADNVAKFGGGSLLTAAVGSLILGSIGWPVIIVIALTLLSFIVATIVVSVAEVRAAAYEFAAERIGAALKETQ